MEIRTTLSLSRLPQSWRMFILKPWEQWDLAIYHLVQDCSHQALAANGQDTENIIRMMAVQKFVPKAAFRAENTGFV